MGEVCLPSRVTGFSAISISEEITFMPGFHARERATGRATAHSCTNHDEETTMTLRTMFAGLCLLSLTTLAAAQNKISGSAQCGKPDVQQQVDVSDHPGHSISIMQMKCTWTKPMEVAGVQDKDGTDSGMADLHAGAGTSHGYYVDNMANGDKAYVHWQGKESKDGS